MEIFLLADAIITSASIIWLGCLLIERYEIVIRRKSDYDNDSSFVNNKVNK
jgi:hypothetical protein